MLVFNFHFPVAPPDKLWNEFHRAGTIQRNQGRDMLDGTNLKFPAQIPHPAGLQLEYSHRIPLVQHLVSLGIIERQIIDWNLHASPRLDHLARIANHRQRLQPQKIHLQQPEIPHWPHRILGDNHSLLVLFERQQID